MARDNLLSGRQCRTHYKASQIQALIRGRSGVQALLLARSL
jgi:hypothetical protein